MATLTFTFLQVVFLYAVILIYFSILKISRPDIKLSDKNRSGFSLVEIVIIPPWKITVTIFFT